MTRRNIMSVITDNCGCCKGIESITPQSVFNRPGLSALTYRVGTYRTFLESMKALISSHYMDIGLQDGDANANSAVNRIRPLEKLQTRDTSDAAIAMMDAWAIVADVLTFYQERIANEGFLATSTLRSSVIALTRLIGYSLKPGVASSVWLALDLDKGYKVNVKPLEIRAQSLPGPGELPQVFENTEEMELDSGWNRLRPRMVRPQTSDSILEDTSSPRIYLKGTSTNLKQTDLLLVTGLDDLPETCLIVKKVVPDTINDRTLVIMEPLPEEEETVTVSSPDFTPVLDATKRYLTVDLTKKFSSIPLRETAIRALNRMADLERLLTGGNMSSDDIHKAVEETAAAIDEEKNALEGDDMEFIDAATLFTAMSGDLAESIKEMDARVARRKAQIMTDTIAKAVPESASYEETEPDPLLTPIFHLTKSPSIPPRSSRYLRRSVARSFARKADTGLTMTGAFNEALRIPMTSALLNVKVTADSPIRVHAFRAVARPFGYNAPMRAKMYGSSETGMFTSYYEWDITDPQGQYDPAPMLLKPPEETILNGKESVAVFEKGRVAQAIMEHSNSVLHLDSTYMVNSGGYIVIQHPKGNGTTYTIVPTGPDYDVMAVDEPVAAYGCAAKSTRIDLGSSTWCGADATFDAVRRTVVHLQSEELELAQEPIKDSIGGDENDSVELDGLYSGLESGRWLIVAGEREDVIDETGNPIRGITAAELVMLADVTQSEAPIEPIDPDTPVDGARPGDSVHTFIRFAEKLKYLYLRDTVNIYGNVVKASHGESRKETLGSGDASRRFQTFSLNHSPLTYVAAQTPQGAGSTLSIYVNDMRWHETDTLATSLADDRHYTVTTDDQDKTSVTFGNGERGLRLPTGTENVLAIYRNGMGKAGNVKAEQISQLIAKPLGITAVVNPLRASGGAQRESIITAKSNAPRSLTALDRLVSVSDYGDFTCRFAGIGKALSTRISDGTREWVHVTIAGADDIPIDEQSDLFRNLLEALHANGDPFESVAIGVRELFLLVISVNVAIKPDFLWDKVSTKIRAKLLDTFSFERRDPGQDVLLSEVTNAIQSVRGVEYADIDVFGGIPEKKNVTANGVTIRRILTPQEITGEVQALLDAQSVSGPPQRLAVNVADMEEGIIRPAQLAYLSPGVADALIINRIE